MMGIQEPDNSKIFYTNLNIAERVRRDHPLRRIAARVDFDFTYQRSGGQVRNQRQRLGTSSGGAQAYASLIFYNVRSERELMSHLPERLDWLWFLGYDLDTKIPDDHSILSKAREALGSGNIQKLL